MRHLALSLLLALSQVVTATYPSAHRLNGPTSFVPRIPLAVEEDQTGTLTLNVQDELTFFAPGSPLVAGAHVVVYDPLTLIVLADGYSPASGIFTATGVPAGGYAVSVTAPSHVGGQTTFALGIAQHLTLSIFLPRSEGVDSDNDGFLTPYDCNDADPNVNPGAQESCSDGIDNDCDGIVNELFIFYADVDGDGFGVAAADSVACSAPIGYVSDSTDLCPNDPLKAAPGTCGCGNVDQADFEPCSDGNACNGLEYWFNCACIAGNPLDCDDGNPCTTDLCDPQLGCLHVPAPDGTTCGLDQQCLSGTCVTITMDSDGDGTNDVDDCAPSDPGVYPGANEVCNGIDDDCDGQVDEGFPLTYQDLDSDGYGHENFVLSCGQPGATLGGDCNDNDANVYPGQGCISCTTADLAWVLNGNQPNFFCISGCSAPTQEEIADCLISCYGEAGLGIPCATCLVAYQLCVSTQCPACLDDPNSAACIQCRQTGGCDAAYSNCSGAQDMDSDGYFAPDDCDDGNALINPFALEGCIADGLDNDCDGLVDEDALQDLDADGFTVCGGDCNDLNDAVNPGLPEICDGFDNDCDGQVDEAFTLYFRDFDGDGYGDPEVPLLCDPQGGVANQLDCYDDDPTMYLGAPELCDGIDNDCDGQVDEIIDDDTDFDGYTTCNGDCDDTNAAIHPTAADICDGLDNDCDGVVDERIALAFDGIDDHVDLGAWFNDETFTIEMWVMPGTTQVDYANIIDYSHSNNIRWVLQQDVGSTNNYYWGVATTNLPLINVPLQAAVWQHIALVKSDTTITAYVNGSLISSQQTTGGVNGAGPHNIRLGNWNNGGRPWNGRMDDVRIWNYALAQDALQSGMYASATAPQPGLLLSHTMEQGIPDGDNTGMTALLDGSGNEHDGVLFGFALNGSTSNVVSDLPFDLDGDGFSQCMGDCDDLNSSLNPGTNETCDGLDNNCNGLVDDGMDYDGDGISNCSDECPSLFGEVGSPCPLSSDPLVPMGIINQTCTCTVACSQNIVVDLRTDLNSHEASFIIRDDLTSAIHCQGGGFVPGINSPIVVDCCLPEGCFKLEVYDTGGDGFVTGGYQVREAGATGRRIIDNFGNFTSGGYSAISDVSSFCLPLGEDKLTFGTCDKLTWVNNQYLVAHENTTVSAEWVINGANNVQDGNSGYEFWIFDPNGGYSLRRFRSHNVSDGFNPANARRACHLKINGWTHSTLTPHAPANTLLNVRLRGRVNGVNLGEFGPACTMRMDVNAAACPLIWLQDDPSNTSDFSCGVTRTWGGVNSAANRLTAKPPQFMPTTIPGPVKYQFRFRIPGEGVCIIRPPQSSPTLHLNWSNGAQLQCSKTYEVDVRASKDGGATWCVDGATPVCYPNQPIPWGRRCSLTIDPCNGTGNAMMPPDPAGGHHVSIFPNPNNGDRLHFSVDEGMDASEVVVEFHALDGALAIRRNVMVEPGASSFSLDLDHDLASGMHIVRITIGERTYIERLVIQE